MFIAKNEELQHIIRGTEVESRTIIQSDLTCPICGRIVEYEPSANHAFEYFSHADGSEDCFTSDRDSDEHRLAVEVAFEAIYNRLTEVTGEPVEMDTERWVGSRTKFVISDVRVSSPLQIAAEIFFLAGDLELGRRIPVLSAHDYRTFLIFHMGGVHNVNRVQRYMQRISSLSVGRFDPETREINLGDLFSNDEINFKRADDVPNYLIYTPS